MVTACRIKVFLTAQPFSLSSNNAETWFSASQGSSNAENHVLGGSQFFYGRADLSFTGFSQIKSLVKPE